MVGNNNNGMSPAVEHKATLTGFGYDVMEMVAKTIQTVLRLTGCQTNGYGHYTPSAPLMNGNKEIVAVGVHIEGGNVYVPCLFRDKADKDDWGYSPGLMGDGEHLWWAGGRYVHDRKTAVDSYLSACGGNVWLTTEGETVLYGGN